MHTSQLKKKADTPSFVQKNPSSNKRIIPTQRLTDRPNQPLPPPSEATNKPGLDDRAPANSNNNPETMDVIPSVVSSNDLTESLNKYSKTNTKLTKVEYHIQFLQTVVDEKCIPHGLKWNIQVNVMEANDAINKEIHEHIANSEKKLIQLMLNHYENTKYSLKINRETNKDKIENMKSTQNEITINESMTKADTETKTLEAKLKQKRRNKLRNLKAGPIRSQESYANVTRQRTYEHLNYLPQNQQPPTIPRSLPHQTPPRPQPPPPLMSRIHEPPRQHYYAPASTLPQNLNGHQPPIINQTENQLGTVVNTFGKFLLNLQQQTNQLLSSLNQLNSTQVRN